MRYLRKKREEFRTNVRVRRCNVQMSFFTHTQQAHIIPSLRSTPYTVSSTPQAYPFPGFDTRPAFTESWNVVPSCLLNVTATHAGSATHSALHAFMSFGDPRRSSKGRTLGKMGGERRRRKGGGDGRQEETAEGQSNVVTLDRFDVFLEDISFLHHKSRPTMSVGHIFPSLNRFAVQPSTINVRCILRPGPLPPLQRHQPWPRQGQ